MKHIPISVFISQFCKFLTWKEKTYRTTDTNGSKFIYFEHIDNICHFVIPIGTFKGSSLECLLMTNKIETHTHLVKFPMLEFIFSFLKFFCPIIKHFFNQRKWFLSIKINFVVFQKSLLNYAILSQDSGDSSLRRLAHKR